MPNHRKEIEALGRNPEAQPVIQTNMILGIAFAEAIAIYALVVAVMIGASIGFAIPAGYQTHMMVYSAGGYRFTDFIRVVVPLDILCLVLGSIFIPIFFPF